MCLAVPVRVVELRGKDAAIVDLGGIRKEVSLALVDGVAVGDYVILHVGYALTRLDPAEASARWRCLPRRGWPARTTPPLQGGGREGMGLKQGNGDPSPPLAPPLEGEGEESAALTEQRDEYIDEFRDGELARASRRESRAKCVPIAATSSWSSAAGTPTPSRATASPTCCRAGEAGARAGVPGVRCCRSAAWISPSGWRSSTGVAGHLRRLPARARSDGLSLLKAKARGAKIAMVYSAADALELARRNPAQQVVFFAIGFRDHHAAHRAGDQAGGRRGDQELQRGVQHVLTPSAITSILESPEVRSLGTVPLDGFIGPAHVSTVIGSRPYEHFAQEYAKRW